MTRPTRVISNGQTYARVGWSLAVMMINEIFMLRGFAAHNKGEIFFSGALFLGMAWCSFSTVMQWNTPGFHYVKRRNTRG